MHVGQLSGAGVQRSVLVFAVLLVHSLPEGFAIGTAFASDTEGLGLFVILAIALQNIPEGTATAIPMEAAGFSRPQQFWAAVLSSAPQPRGGPDRLRPRSADPGTAGLFVRLRSGRDVGARGVELLPQAFRRGHLKPAAAGSLVGAALMLLLAVTLGV